MSDREKAAKKQQKRVGRPATGRTTDSIQVSIDKKLLARAKREAAKRDVSFSAFANEALAQYIGKGDLK